MADKPTAPGLDAKYLKSMRAYVSEGGRLSHENALELLDQVGRRRNALIEECALAAEQDLTDCKWAKDSISEAILKRAGDNVRRLKSDTGHA